LGIAIHSHAAPLQFNGYYNGGRLIYDPNTDLTWYQPAYSSAGCVWTDALNWVANLNIGGVTGWQLPSIAPLTPADLDGTGATIQTGQNNMATYWTQYATQYADLPHEQERSPIPLFYILLIFNTL
jgi:hypothetical protein